MSWSQIVPLAILPHQVTKLIQVCPPADRHASLTHALALRRTFTCPLANSVTKSVPMFRQDMRKAFIRARALLEMPRGRACEFKPMGVQGDTFLLKPSDQGTQYIVRVLLLDKAGVDTFIAVSTALSKAGVSPRVVASDDTMIITEHVIGTSCLESVLKGDTATIAAMGALAARLHSCDPSALGDVSTAGDSGLAFWWKKTKPYMRAMPEKLTAFFTKAVEQGLACDVSGPAGAVVLTHGDLNMGNILLPTPATATEGKVEEGEAPKVWLVEAEHVANSRIAGSDIAYLFATWADMMALAGWMPSLNQVFPYPPLIQRQAFARAYLAELGDGSTPSGTDVNDFLFQVEVCGERQRVRLMMDSVVMAQGDPAHPIGARVVHFVDHVVRARKLLATAAAGDNGLRARIIVLGCTGVAALMSVDEECMG